MIAEAVLEKFIVNLTQLKEEISLYKNEGDIWIVKADIKNSAGTLTLHLIGNLKHFIGATLGLTGYIRNRDKEFSDRNVSRAELLIEIDKVIVILENVLPSIKDEDMSKIFPIEFAGKGLNNLQMLVQLATHFNYHLGQINYHRRLLT